MPPSTHDATPVVRKCFVISPIGADGSPERDHADNVYEFIIRPAIAECGLSAHRADHLQEPGKITEQMIRDITTSDCCVVVLTGHNPNVFYELAVAHAVGTPVVTLIERSEDVPFDIAHHRCIRYDLNPMKLFRGAYKDEVAAYLRKVAASGWERRPLFGTQADPAFGQLSAGLSAELSADWVTKRDRLSTGQRRLLKALEQAIERHGGAVPVDDLVACLTDKYTPSELHYRLESLRLLGFVELTVSQTTKTFGESARHDYSLSAGYQAVATGEWKRQRPLATPRLGPSPNPSQLAANVVPPSADICPVNRATQVYREGESFELAACGQRMTATGGRLTVNGRDYGGLSDGDRIEVLSNGSWTVNGQPRMPE